MNQRRRRYWKLKAKERKRASAAPASAVPVEEKVVAKLRSEDLVPVVEEVVLASPVEEEVEKEVEPEVPKRRRRRRRSISAKVSEE
tara:strand:- start:24920 stop:25177 length:258 start_codon:yes stop_codon:yes gene_type:complete